MAKAYAGRLKGTGYIADDSNGYDLGGHLKEAAGILLTGQMPSSATAKTTNPLDDELKRQRLLTEDPDFQMKLAQTKADMAAQQALDVEEEKIRREREAYLAANSQSGSSVTGRLAASEPQVVQSAVPTPAPTPGSTIPRFIEKTTPGKAKWDAGMRMNIMEPGETKVEDNPQYKELVGPLAGEQAVKFAGAQQGKQTMNDIFKLLKLSPTGKTTSGGQPEYKSDVPVVKRIWDKFQQDAAGSTGLIGGKNIPGLSDLMRTPQFLADEEARVTDNKYQTLAEDLLRSRTGAAAPEPEIIRELARTLNRLGDNPTVVANRLLTNEQFIDSVIENIRPGYLQYKGIGPASQAYSPQQQVGSKPGGQVMTDAQGNKAVVYPDGTFEEIA